MSFGNKHATAKQITQTIDDYKFPCKIHMVYFKELMTAIPFVTKTDKLFIGVDGYICNGKINRLSLKNWMCKKGLPKKVAVLSK